uniref:CopG family ribbon-helix-helix protein n=1 Tax=Serratia TaxID=613 RepID=UPI001F4C2C3E|nr:MULTISPECIES: ribbon-helix-helix protein, CopG family [Serratia]ULG12097.1 CopG family transcriptional regulator [Serratia entomophila]ULG12390.1 CopG family transcriptional regulator [Serratia entomophila]ULG16024.1 CopG family transcriptional regulator [Serratia proteamaculans]ULG18423.1 CopG family transcriptional regulator [Serratia proteamaculans]ULG19600.1 CopG family transcriptional regulator [Serratia proteamaculans]
MVDTARQTTTLRIEQDIKERLKTLADDRHSSAHALMLEAIAEYVVREEKRSQSRKEALAAWQEYQDTGEHIAADEIIVWLESWGSGQERGMPANDPGPEYDPGIIRNSVPEWRRILG